MERPKRQLKLWPGFQKSSWDRITGLISAQSSFLRESFCDFLGKVKSLPSTFLPDHATPPSDAISASQSRVYFYDFWISINATPQPKCEHMTARLHLFDPSLLK